MANKKLMMAFNAAEIKLEDQWMRRKVVLDMKLNKVCVFTGFVLLFVIMLLPRNVRAEDKIKTLYVNGIDVLSSASKDDVLGDGTVSFDVKSGVLTLAGATLTKGYAKESYAENPRIFFEGGAHDIPLW